MNSIAETIIKLSRKRCQLANFFNDKLGEGYDVEIFKKINDGNNSMPFDIVVYYEHEPVLVVLIEEKSFTSPDNVKKFVLEEFRSTDVPFNLYYGTDDNYTIIYHKHRKLKENVTFQEVIDIITDRTNGDCKCPDIKDVIKYFLQSFNQAVDISKIEDYTKFKLKNEVKSIITKENISFNNEENTINLITSIEDKFFKLLLPHKKVEAVCRYTSVNNLFRTLNKKTHCMLSIPCMNDKGELVYADEMIGKKQCIPPKSKVKEDNDCFILSCCDEEKQDDLTLWRLYGDNAKGACLVYEVDENAIDNKHFFLSPITYFGDENSCGLNFMYFFEKNHFKGWKFVFKRWHIWKHFFKSYIFKDEQEIRLIYIPDEKDKDFEWIRDNSNGIISRIKTFGINDSRIKFPLTLKKVIIGPKCNELESVVSQLNFMNDCQGVIENNGFDPIVKSDIEDYR